MDKINILGKKNLRGVVEVSGSKNAALPILISSLLTQEPCRYSRIPNLMDIRTILKLLSKLGAKTDASDLSNQNQVELQANQIHSYEAPYELVSTMRASVLVLGPLLARFGTAKVSLPGGCAIGARPINFHLAGLEKLGASITLEGGYVIARAKRLQGTRIILDFPSVGATENLLMASTLAKGETVLENCAKEPEVIDLALALKKMGAEISGEGTEKITIQGKTDLGGLSHQVMGDRIEAGTYLVAGFGTQGDLTVRGIDPEFLSAVLVKLEEAGARISRQSDSVSISGSCRPKATSISTLPYPGFPTDMQAQFMTLMTIAEGTSTISENIFENRFMHVSELCRLRADISVQGNTAMVKGQPKLLGAPIMATDLRASASLILGGLFAEGETTVSRIYHLDRGYEKMEKKLQLIGADIERVKEKA